MAAKGTQVTGVASPASASLASLLSCSLDSTGSVVPSARPITMLFVLFKWLIYHFLCPASVVLPLQPLWPPGLDLHLKTLNLLVYLL